MHSSPSKLLWIVRHYFIHLIEQVYMVSILGALCFLVISLGILQAIVKWLKILHKRARSIHWGVTNYLDGSVVWFVYIPSSLEWFSKFLYFILNSSILLGNGFKYSFQIFYWYYWWWIFPCGNPSCRCFPFMVCID